jgi:hypothetical protein
MVGSIPLSADPAHVYQLMLSSWKLDEREQIQGQMWQGKDPRERMKAQSRSIVQHGP